MLSNTVAFFAARPALTVTAWVVAIVFGTTAYTTLMPREGFPSIDIPVGVASGTYLVGDANRVDAEVTLPIAEALVAVPEVDSVQSFSQANGFTVIVDFGSGTTSIEGAALIRATVDRLDLPPEATVSAQPIDGSRFLDEYDLLVGVYGPTDVDAAALEAAAARIVPHLAAEPDVARAEVQSLITQGIDPNTGQPIERESSFNLLTAPAEGGVSYRPSIAVGVVAVDGVDSLGIRDAADRALEQATAEGALPPGFEATVAIDFATQIRQQISSLQSNVLTGVIAVALVALVLISWRASVVTALFIATVLATTFGLLHLLGITLNTISLFGVILALGLFVDDAIVITESIAAARAAGAGAGSEPAERPLAIIRHAIGRVGSASLSGTLTTVLVFAPMLAISGILGEFIRILPLSVIVALVVSVVLSFVFIPIAARYLVLAGPARPGPLGRLGDAAAEAVAGLVGVGGRRGAMRAGLAVGLSVAMTLIGLMVFAPRVGSNIFPPQKDSIAVGVTIDYPPGTSIEDARRLALDVNQRAADALGADLEQGYTYSGNERSALGQLRLTPIGDRAPAPELVDSVLEPLASTVDGARVRFAHLSAGPPEAAFPFQVQVFADDVDVLAAAATAVRSALDGATIERRNGTTFDVVETEIAPFDSVTRSDGRRYVEVRARFDADDVTTLTSQTEAYLTERFGPDDLAALGLGPDALGFDFGLESDNQESFSSLPVAFGIALMSMLVLLVVQFRSTVQWFLVFLAIPFSFFGVFGGLLLTGNVVSFFVMLGLIGLIGIAVNNTILLVDYANQERAAGQDRRSAIQSAVRARFRPLVATSLTTVAGLTPLALSDPFWEALGMTIIFGLLSSTFLVLISFPFYYLGIEAVRDRFVTPWRRGRSGPRKQGDQGDRSVQDRSSSQAATARSASSSVSGVATPARSTAGTHS